MALCSRLARGPGALPHPEQTVAANSERHFFPRNNSRPDPRVCRVSAKSPAGARGGYCRARLQQGPREGHRTPRSRCAPPSLPAKNRPLDGFHGLWDRRPCREAGARPAPELAVPSEPFQSPYHEPHGKPQLLPWEGSDPSEGDGHGTRHRPERVRSHGAVAGAAGRPPAARSHGASLTETFRAARRSPAVNRTRCVCILSKASCILDCSDLNGGEESTARQTASVTASARRSCPCDLVKTRLASGSDQGL